MSSILVWGTKIPHAVGQLNLCATATEDFMLQTPSSETREVRAETREQPPLAATRESPHAAVKSPHGQK